MLNVIALANTASHKYYYCDSLGDRLNLTGDFVRQKVPTVMRRHIDRRPYLGIHYLGGRIKDKATIGWY